MPTIKNVTPGVLLIADSRTRLEPGQAVQVESLSPETERAIALGLAIVSGRPGQEKAPREAAASKPEPPTPPTESPVADPVASSAPAISDELARLSPGESLDRIAAENDAARLRIWLGAERRKGVADAIRKRLSEVSVAAR